MQGNNPESRQKGVTLIELLVTLSVLAISLTIAAFSFKEVISRNQVNTAANDLVGALNFARSEAVTRGQTVAVCRSVDGIEPDAPGTPVPSCHTGGGNWADGWIVFVDADGNGARGAGEELLRTYAQQRGGVTMVGNGTAVNSVRYLPTGFFPATPGNATVVVANTGKTLKVIMSKSGRVRISTSS